MSRQRRRELMRILLPALLVAAIYAVSFGRIITGNVADMERALAAARNDTPSSTDIEDAARRGASADADLLRLRAAAHVAPSATPGTPPDSRLRDAEQLTALCASYGLRLIDERMDPIPLGATLSAALQRPDSKGVTASLSGSRVRTLRFEGRYLDVLAALEGLVSTNTNIVPVRLHMDRAAEGGGLLTWSLSLWI